MTAPTAGYGWEYPFVSAPFEIVDFDNASLRDLTRQERAKERGERLVADSEDGERPAERLCW
jgi:hypothetical protein